jgi:hypothetical protein
MSIRNVYSITAAGCHTGNRNKVVQMDVNAVLRKCNGIQRNRALFLAIFKLFQQREKVE